MSTEWTVAHLTHKLRDAQSQLAARDQRADARSRAVIACSKIVSRSKLCSAPKLCSVLSIAEPQPSHSAEHDAAARASAADAENSNLRHLAQDLEEEISRLRSEHRTAVDQRESALSEAASATQSAVESSSAAEQASRVAAEWQRKGCREVLALVDMRMGASGYTNGKLLDIRMGRN